jgi:hypothetical protein
MSMASVDLPGPDTRMAGEHAQRQLDIVAGEVVGGGCPDDRHPDGTARAVDAGRRRRGQDGGALR